MSKQLTEAARIGDLKGVNELLKQQSEMECASENDNEALMEASKNGHESVVKRLLQIPVVRESSQALEAAAILGHLDVMESLFKMPRNLGDIGWAIALAAERNNLPIVELLLKQANEILIDPEELQELVPNYDLGLLKAASEGHLEMLQTLLSNAPPECNINITMMLSSAARKGHLKVVRFLLVELFSNSEESEKAKNENIRKIKNVLLEAVGSGQLAIIELLLYLLSDELDLDDVERLMIEAVGSGQRAVFDRFSKIPAFSNWIAADTNRSMLLHTAIREFQLDMIRWLLQIPIFKQKAVFAADLLKIAAQSMKNSMGKIRIGDAKESYGPAIIYLLAKTYQSLGIELPLDLKFEDKPLSKFLEDYEKRLDIQENLFKVLPVKNIVEMVDGYAEIFLEMLKLLDMPESNQQFSRLQHNILIGKSNALYPIPIRLISSTSSSNRSETNFTYEMSDGSQENFYEEQVLGLIEAKSEQERLEQARVFQLRTQLTLEPVQENSQLEAMRRAFSVLFSKENFIDVSYCFTKKNVLEALNDEPTLKPFRIYIDTLKTLGQIEESDFESILSEHSPINHSLKENIKRLYQEQRDLGKDSVPDNEAVQEPLVTSMSTSTQSPPTKDQTSDTQIISEPSSANISPTIHFAYSGASESLKWCSRSEPNLTMRRMIV